MPKGQRDTSDEVKGGTAPTGRSGKRRKEGRASDESRDRHRHHKRKEKSNTLHGSTDKKGTGAEHGAKRSKRKMREHKLEDSNAQQRADQKEHQREKCEERKKGHSGSHRHGSRRDDRKRSVPPSKQEVTCDVESAAPLSKCVRCSIEVSEEHLVVLATCQHQHCKECVEEIVGTLLQDEACDTADVVRCSDCDAMASTQVIIGCLKHMKAHDWLKRSLRGLLVTLERAKTTPDEEICPACGSAPKLDPLVLIIHLDEEWKLEVLSGAAGPVFEEAIECAAVACFATCAACQHKYCRLCRRECGDTSPHFMNLCEAGYAGLVAEVLHLLDRCSQEYCSPAALEAQQQSCDVFGLGEKERKGSNEEITQGSPDKGGKKKKNGRKKEEKGGKEVMMTRGGGTGAAGGGAGVGYGGRHRDEFLDLKATATKEDSRRKRLSQVLAVLSKIISFSVTSLEPHPALFPLLRTSCLLPVMSHFLRSSWLMEASLQDSELFYSISALLRSLLRNQVLYSIMESPIRDDNGCTLQKLCSEHVRQSELFLKQHQSFEANEDDAVVNLLGLALDAQSLGSQLESAARAWRSVPRLQTHLVEMPKAVDKAIDVDVKKKKKRFRLLKAKPKKSAGSSAETTAAALEAKAAAYVASLAPLQFDFTPDFQLPPGTRMSESLQEAIEGANCGSHTLMRLSQELSAMATTLPLSYDSGIFLRVSEANINQMKALIIGPVGTPYENGCFEFAIVAGEQYNSHPPVVQFLTTHGGAFRFNPNLYDCGKVCLSLLGTWSGPGWDPQVSTILQVLVSIQSLIFVPDPYFNEPSYERKRGTPGGDGASNRYNQRVYYYNFVCMIDTLTNPPIGFEEVVRRHFYAKKDDVLRMCSVHGTSKEQSALAKLLGDLEPPSLESE